MRCPCRITRAYVLSLHETPRIVHEGRHAGRGSRAVRRLKEEAGSHCGCGGHLGGVRGGCTEDPGAEEAARQGQPVRLRTQQGWEDDTSACQPLLALLGVVQGSGEMLGGSAESGEGMEGQGEGARGEGQKGGEGSEEVEGEGDGVGEGERKGEGGQVGQKKEKRFF